MDAAEFAARRIKAARAELRWNQEDLAEQLGVSQNQIAKWESGKANIGINTIQRIAGALGKPMSFFVEEDISLPKEERRAVTPKKKAA